MTGSNGQTVSTIDKRDFDSHRPLLDGFDAGGDVEEHGAIRSRPVSRLAAANDEDGLLNDVVEEILERDRKKMAREVVRIGSFVWGVITW